MKMDFKLEEWAPPTEGAHLGIAVVGAGQVVNGAHLPAYRKGGLSVAGNIRPRPGEGGGDGRQVWRREGVPQSGGASGTIPARISSTWRCLAWSRRGSRWRRPDGASICCARSRWRPASKMAGR